MEKKKKILIGVGIALVLILLLVLIFFFCFKKEEYSVTFKVDDKIYKTLDEVKEGTKIDLPAKPTKEGYTFEGWYVDGEKFDFDTKINENLQLEARFSINTYTVTFDFNNETKNEEVKVKYNEKVTKPKQPKKDGYNFIGWYIDEDEFDFNKTIKKDTTITAKWTKDTTAKYTVEHYLMGVDGKYKNANLIERFNGTIGDKVTPTVKKYDGFTSPVKETVEIKEDDSTNVKYYYERNKYTITVTGDEGTSDTTGTGTYYYGSKIKIGATLNKGYNISSWNNKNKNLSFDYTVGDSDTTFTITTKLIKYNIKYLAVLKNGEVTLDTDNPTSYTVKDTITLNVPSVEGYTFKNYTLNNEEIIDNTILEGTTGDLVVKALFDINKYNVEFKTELGKFNSDEERKIKVEYQSLIPNSNDPYYIPMRDYYEFTGWSLNKESEEQTLYDFNTPMGTDNITLYPIWEPIEYKIEYKLNSDEICSSCKDYKTYNVESLFTLPVPKRTGYKFDGWITEDNQVIKTITKGMNGDLVLTAKWLKLIDVEYVDNILNKDTGFSNAVNGNTLNVGFKDVDIEKSITTELIETLKNNVDALLTDEHITKLTINDKEVTKDTLEEILIEVLNNQDLTQVKYSDLLKIQLNAKVSLDNDIAIASVNDKTNENLDYVIKFRTLKKITLNELQPLITQNTGFINSHKDDHYEVVVEGENKDQLVFKYAKPKKDVFTSMMGAGLKTAMQTFLGDEKVGYVVITFKDMGPVKVTYDDIKGSDFWGFGLSLLSSFEKAIGGKDAFDLINQDLLAFNATLDIYAADGKYFDDSFVTHYDISFAQQ